MAPQNHFPFSPSHSLSSPSLSAVRSSPLASGTLTPLPTTSPSSPFTFSSSPPFSFTQAAASSPSPDLFEDFTYSDDMAEDFRRIDTQAAAIIGSGVNDVGTPDDGETPQTPSRDEKTWVVFNGRAPGIYDYMYFFLFGTNHSRAHLVTLAEEPSLNLNPFLTAFRRLSQIARRPWPLGLPL